MSLFYTINGNVCTTQNIACIFNEPLNPLNLPLNIVRVRTRDGLPPKKLLSGSYETATLVDAYYEKGIVSRARKTVTQSANTTFTILDGEFD